VQGKCRSSVKHCVIDVIDCGQPTLPAHGKLCV
jgi:hypothetical protein